MTAREQPEHTDDSSAFRAALRREKLAARNALDPQKHAQLSAQITTYLSARLGAMPAACIGFCLAMRSEFDASPVITQLLDAGWQACVPVASRPAAAMEFRLWSPLVTIHHDRYGVPAPVSAVCATPNILLLPLVAFDAAGFRLGYGGGYFDRTLAASVPRPLCIGIGFELGRVASIRPQPHDQACDWLLTEAGWGFPVGASDA